jgi:hypothetical protein
VRHDRREAPRASLISRLRAAAREAGEVEVEHGGGDAVELAALARAIAGREGRTAECAAHPLRPDVLTVRFRRAAGTGP